ncbi:MAG: hypothetical protein JXA93_15480 [Anaerolineae bacterium]|nr:hypothetical protein [Anaerolineae bacterium]
MTDTWIVLAVVVGVVLVVDLVTTQVRRRARRISAPLDMTQKETEPDVCKE